MITDVISSAAFASTEATHTANPQFRALPSDNAMALGFSILPLALQQVDTIARYRRLASGDLRIKLLNTQALWAEFAGWLSDDLGDETNGTWWISQAMDMAQEAGNGDFVGYLFARKAQRFAAGPDRDRVRGLAEAAIRTSVTANVKAFAAVQLAHGHAISRDKTAFLDAMSQARSLVNAEDAANGGLGSFCDESYFWVQEGEGWLHLRQPRRAVYCFENGLKSLPVTQLRERGLCLSRTAFAQTLAGEPDAAAITALAALEAADMTRSSRIRRPVLDVGRRLAGHANLPAVRTFIEVLDSGQRSSL